MKRMLALVLALCLPLTALAQEEDWVAQESLRTASPVKSGNAVRRVACSIAMSVPNFPVS